MKVSVFILSLLVIQCYSVPIDKPWEYVDTTAEKVPSEASKSTAKGTSEIIQTAEAFKEKTEQKTASAVDINENSDNDKHKVGPPLPISRHRRDADATDTKGVSSEASKPASKDTPSVMKTAENHKEGIKEKKASADELKENYDKDKYEVESGTGDENIGIVRQKHFKEPLSEPQSKGEIPVKEPLKYDSPVEKARKDKSPVEEPPKHASPVKEVPKYDSPVEEPPKYENPVEEPPKYASSLGEAPKYASPVKEPPKYESPVEELPKHASPVAEAPKYESPADKSATKHENRTEPKKVLSDVDDESESQSSLGPEEDEINADDELRSAIGVGGGRGQGGLFDPFFSAFNDMQNTIATWEYFRRMLHTMAVMTGIC